MEVILLWNRYYQKRALPRDQLTPQGPIFAPLRPSWAHLPQFSPSLRPTFSSHFALCFPRINLTQLLKLFIDTSFYSRAGCIRDKHIIPALEDLDIWLESLKC